jgi:hypothetical protein
VGGSGELLGGGDGGRGLEVTFPGSDRIGCDRLEVEGRAEGGGGEEVVDGRPAVLWEGVFGVSGASCLDEGEEGMGGRVRSRAVARKA